MTSELLIKSSPGAMGDPHEARAHEARTPRGGMTLGAFDRQLRMPDLEAFARLP